VAAAGHVTTVFPTEVTTKGATGGVPATTTAMAAATTVASECRG
jgi:hypothetical protein